MDIKGFFLIKLAIYCRISLNNVAMPYIGKVLFQYWNGIPKSIANFAAWYNKLKFQVEFHRATFVNWAGIEVAFMQKEESNLL